MLPFYTRFTLHQCLHQYKRTVLRQASNKFKEAYRAKKQNSVSPTPPCPPSLFQSVDELHTFWHRPQELGTCSLSDMICSAQCLSEGDILRAGWITSLSLGQLIAALVLLVGKAATEFHASLRALEDLSVEAVRAVYYHTLQ